MLPLSIDIFLRSAGIIVSAMLLIQPWFISVDSNDPFIYQQWIVFSATSICLCILSVLLIFFRPRFRQVPFIRSFFVIFLIIITSTLLSNYFVSLRTSLFWLSLLLITLFLRLSMDFSNTLPILSSISLSGFAMSIYGFFQLMGYDPLVWSFHTYKVVGTFSNPNYLAAYLMVTAIITLGLAISETLNAPKTRIILLLMFFSQFAIIIYTHCFGALLGLLLGIILLLTTFWEIRPGKVFRYSPFISGTLIALFFLFTHYFSYYASINYPWNSLTEMPGKYFSVVTRLIIWQMGFASFMKAPLIGAGLGSSSYIMPAFRHPLGSALGLSSLNTDPHSAPLTLLIETGVLGLIAFSTLFSIIYGCYVWRSFKTTKENLKQRNTSETAKMWQQLRQYWHIPTGEPQKQSTIHLVWFFVAAILLLLLYAINLLSAQALFLSIASVIAFFCIFNSYLDIEVSETNNLQKITMVSIIIILFHSLFNNNTSLPSMTTLLALLTAVHFNTCLKKVAWKRRFSFLSILYLLFPPLLILMIFNLQTKHHRENINLFSASKAFDSENYQESKTAFEKALSCNSQSYFAYHGLALTHKKLNNYEQAHNILIRLNQLIPNVFNLNYKLANMLFERHQILEAHRYLIKSLDTYQNPLSYELLGKILLAEGLIDKAEQAFKDGLIMVPRFISEERLAAERIKLYLASIEFDRGNLDKSQEYLLELSPLTNNSINALYLRAMIASRNNDLKRSLKLFERILQLEPENPKYLNAVGYLLTQNDSDLDRAQSLLETAYRLIKQKSSPMLSDLLNISHSLGVLYWKQGKFKEAEKLLEIAFQESLPEWEEIRRSRLKDLKAFYKATNNQEKLKQYE